MASAQERKAVAANCRWWASLSLLVLTFLYYPLFGVFGLIDFSGYTVFGAGVFYIMTLSLHLLFFGIWIVCSSIEASYVTKSPATSAAALFHWPRYTWDIWTWVTGNIVMFCTLTVSMIIYMAKFGFSAKPDFTVQSQIGDMYQTVSLMLVVFCIALFLQSIDAISAYIGKPYPLMLRLKIKELASEYGLTAYGGL